MTKFRKVKIGNLEQLVEQGGTYPGGSNATNLGEFKAYIEGKTLRAADGGDEVPAGEAYRVCSYCDTTHAKASENGLLSSCDGVYCPYNKQKRSNLVDGEPGFVYVLHD